MLTVKARNRSSDRWALTELWTSLVMQRVRPSQSVRSAQTLTCCGVALSNITDGSYTVTQLNSIGVLVDHDDWLRRCRGRPSLQLLDPSTADQGDG